MKESDQLTTELNKPTSAAGQPDFIKLLQENLARDQEILKAIKDIKRHIRWQQIWSTLRFLIIIIPIILGFIYLPPLIKDALKYINHFSTSFGPR